MIVLIHGPDAAIAHSKVAEVLAQYDAGGDNTSYIDGRDTSLSAIASAAGSVGFFGGRRVVVVQDLMARASRGAGKAATHDTTDAEAVPTGGLDFRSLFAAVPEQNVLLLVDASLDTVPAAVKKEAPAGTMVIGAEPPRGTALLSWLATVAEDAGGRFDARSARLLAETLYPQTWSARPSNPRYDRPPDTALLRNEVAKLVLAAHPGPITAQHIQQLVAGVPDDRLFRFVEAAESHRLDVAVLELGRLLDAGEEPAKLAAQLGQQVELGAVAATAPTIDPLAVGRALGLSTPARMVNIAKAQRGRSPAAMVAMLQATVATDRDLKRGRLRRPDDALYRLLAPLPQNDGGT
jgi:DNA polymerase III delta subunit